MLSQRLKELEAEGILDRRVFPETPVRIEYALTVKGRELERAVEVIETWADEWARPSRATANPLVFRRPIRDLGSAERAVDLDLVEGALESGQLLIV